MKRFAKISLVLATAGVIAAAVVLLIALLNSDHHRKFARMLPSPIRVYYLNYVYDDPACE